MWLYDHTTFTVQYGAKFDWVDVQMLTTPKAQRKEKDNKTVACNQKVQ